MFKRNNTSSTMIVDTIVNVQIGTVSPCEKVAIVLVVGDDTKDTQTYSPVTCSSYGQLVRPLCAVIYYSFAHRAVVIIVACSTASDSA